MGWNNVFINLMVMDYGSAIPGVCTVVNGRCDMGLSGINAAESLHRIYGVPYSSIELTPMIGGNDVIDNVFTLADTATITAYALRVGLGGLHHWSLDRDLDCAAGSWASPTCNSYGTAGPLGFTNAFLQALGSVARGDAVFQHVFFLLFTRKFQISNGTLFFDLMKLNFGLSELTH